MLEPNGLLLTSHGQRGKLIVIEGFDGAGKSTQIEKLAAASVAVGRAVLVTKQPTDWYRGLPEVRQLLENGTTAETARALALAAASDRLMHCSEVIMPSLEQGYTVICDRYVYSSIAFFAARGVPSTFVAMINEGVLRPDAAFYLDIPAEVSQTRLKLRDGNNLKFEELSLEKIDSVMQNFRMIGSGLEILDANRSIDSVFTNIWNTCSALYA